MKYYLKTIYESGVFDVWCTDLSRDPETIYESLVHDGHDLKFKIPNHVSSYKPEIWIDSFNDVVGCEVLLPEDLFLLNL